MPAGTRPGIGLLKLQLCSPKLNPKLALLSHPAVLRVLQWGHYQAKRRSQHRTAKHLKIPVLRFEGLVLSLFLRILSISRFSVFQAVFLREAR
jgi:hypothetical protein